MNMRGANWDDDLKPDFSANSQIPSLVDKLAAPPSPVTHGVDCDCLPEGEVCEKDNDIDYRRYTYELDRPRE